MALPTWDSVTPQVADAFYALQAKWVRLETCDWDRTNRWIRNTALAGPAVRFPTLEHRLSEEFSRRAGGVVMQFRSADEVPHKLYARDRLKAAMEGSDLIPALSSIVQRVKGGSALIRTTSIRSETDQTGSFVEYPDAEEVRPFLANLHTWLLKDDGRPAAFSGTVAMTAICNIHPFPDGNGRLSRIAFNAILGSQNTTAYLPLNEFSELSRGGFLIALRLAQYRNEWAWMAQFLNAATDLVLDARFC